MVFDEVVHKQHYDLVVGDEAWDVDHFLHENPGRKHSRSPGSRTSSAVERDGADRVAQMLAAMC